ncbi:MAG: hypothetical protein M3Z26_14550 [Bacteroidota bacterium]|nr:hypothetical protein [Bacteroidota bacterium]
MNKILFIKDLDYWGKKIQESGIMVTPLFKKIPFFLRPLRIFHLKYGFPFKNIWYNDWENELSNFEIIILTAANFTVHIAKYIDGLNLRKNIRLIYWYWDPVRSKYAPDKISDKWEKWTFDEADCKNYNLKYNSTYYFNSISLNSQNVVYDVFFIGQNKRRIDELLFLKSQLENFSLKVYFNIVADEKLFYNKKVFSMRLSYSEVLNYISKSKSILELVQQNQSGLTLRSMEALFFNKKLITNNSSIKKYDLYCKENIFIIGEDDINGIQQFINTPYKILNKSIIDQYDFKNWLQRLVNNIQLN